MSAEESVKVVEEDKRKGLPAASNGSLVLPRTAGMHWKKTFPGLNLGVGVGGGGVAGRNTARQRGSENSHCLPPCPHRLTQVLYLLRLTGGAGVTPRSKGEV